MRRVFISELSAYRILKAAALITAPDYVVINAAEEFKDKTTAINQMWQTDLPTKIIGWGCDQAVVQHKPRLLSDNGSCYISSELADWLEEQKMDHVRGAPFHPQTQGS